MGLVVWRSWLGVVHLAMSRSIVTMVVGGGLVGLLEVIGHELSSRGVALLVFGPVLLVVASALGTRAVLGQSDIEVVNGLSRTVIDRRELLAVEWRRPALHAMQPVLQLVAKDSRPVPVFASMALGVRSRRMRAEELLEWCQRDPVAHGPFIVSVGPSYRRDWIHVGSVLPAVIVAALSLGSFGLLPAVGLAVLVGLLMAPLARRLARYMAENDVDL